MKALTIRQPHASLVAVGAKTIETKSRPTSYRGPLLIHAGKHKPRGTMMSNGMIVSIVGDYDVLRWGGRTWMESEDGEYELPLGAVVASCQLVDCVPIDDDPDALARMLFDHRTGRGHLTFPWVDRDLAGTREIYRRMADKERPFGDFSPGRYAWLLGDVRATTERCPRCWGDGLDPGDSAGWYRAAPNCDVCRGEKVCAPVPMRGRQGLWTPTADDWTLAA